MRRALLFIMVLAILISLAPMEVNGQEFQMDIPESANVGDDIIIENPWSGPILLEAVYPGMEISWILETGENDDFHLPAPYMNGDMMVRFHYSEGEDLYSMNLTMSDVKYINITGFTDEDMDGLDDSWEGMYDVSDPLKDEDNDDLTNVQEMYALSNPKKKDSDNDEMEDAWEFKNGTLPFEYDAYGDPDLDEWSNIKEMVGKTDPRDQDDHPVEPPFTAWYWIALIFLVMLLILGYFVKQLFNRKSFEDDMEEFDRKTAVKRGRPLDKGPGKI